MNLEGWEVLELTERMFDNWTREEKEMNVKGWLKEAKERQIKKGIIPATPKVYVWDFTIYYLNSLTLFSDMFVVKLNKSKFSRLVKHLKFSKLIRKSTIPKFTFIATVAFFLNLEYSLIKHFISLNIKVYSRTF